MTADALTLRIAGHPLDQIAVRLGYPDADAAAEAVHTEIGRTRYGLMPEAYALHLLRLDTIADALAVRDPQDQPDRAARLARRVQHQRLTALASLADRLQRADSGRQTRGHA